MKKSFLLLMVCLSSLFISCDNISPEDELRKQQVMEYRANKMSIYENENAIYDDYEVDVAFLGDSITDLYDVNLYYPQYLVSNRGIGGDNTFDLQSILQTTLFDLKPKVATMLIGANNLELMFDNYRDILSDFKTHASNTKIILLSLTPMGGQFANRNPRAIYNNLKIKWFAEKYGFEYVDLYTSLLNKQTNQIYSHYAIDGLHLSDEGYEVITSLITPAIERQLLNWHNDNN